MEQGSGVENILRGVDILEPCMSVHGHDHALHQIEAFLDECEMRGRMEEGESGPRGRSELCYKDGGSPISLRSLFFIASPASKKFTAASAFLVFVSLSQGFLV